MSKKNIALIALFLVLLVIYIFNFTNLFAKRNLEIATRIRPEIARHGRTRTMVPVGNSVSFLFNGKYQLTSIKVVEEADMKTNKYPHALWCLITESNSIPTKAISYGIPVKGMKPEFEKARPEALKPNVPYILLVEAGKLKGQTSFQIK